MRSSRVWFVNNAGNLGDSHVTSSYGVRPVINLHEDVEISSGIGAANDPFVVKVLKKI